MLDRLLSVAGQAADLAVKHATALVGRAVGMAEDLRHRVQGGDEPEPSSERVADAIRRADELDKAPRTRAPSPVTRPPSPPRPATPPPTAPDHIEVEDELVAEFAEAGAEDGAGPEIEVAEPWPGYAKLTASDVIDRLEAASEAERAVVALYERGHKKRKTVLAATGLTGGGR